MDSKYVRVIQANDALVRQIRVAQMQPDVTRVVLDLKRDAEVVTSTLENPYRFIIELRVPGIYEAPTLRVDHNEVQNSAPHADRNQVPMAVAQTTLQSTVPVSSRAVSRIKPFDLGALAVAANRGEAARARLLSLRRISLDPPSIYEIPRPILYDALAAEGLNRYAALAPPTRPGVRLAGSAPVVATETPRAVQVTPAATLAALPEASTPAKLVAPDTTLVRVLGLKLGRVVLDPGHGGKDEGTSRPDGLKEKDVALDIAQRLGALIQERMGSEVIYTRTDDTFIPLTRRTAIANEKKADLFLSIHVNSSPARSATGFETFYLNFTSSRSALETAARENAGSDATIFDLQDLVKQIALKDKLEESREFATRIQLSLDTLAPKSQRAERNRGVKRAPFVVLIGASMPSVLAEVGFMSNSQDANMMHRPEYRQKIAEALYKGVYSYASTLSHFQGTQQASRTAKVNSTPTRQ